MLIARLLAPVLFAALALPAAADSTVTLSGVHLCCGKCVTGVTTAITPVTGAKATCDTTAKTVAITAPDKETLQKAVTALTAAGYYGKSSDDTIKVDAATNAPDGKVTSLEVTATHVCCNSCVTAINDVMKNVPGATANNAKTGATSFTVTGNFEAKTLMEQLQKAGLTGKTK